MIQVISLFLGALLALSAAPTQNSSAISNAQVLPITTPVPPPSGAGGGAPGSAMSNT